MAVSIDSSGGVRYVRTPAPDGAAIGRRRWGERVELGALTSGTRVELAFDGQRGTAYEVQIVRVA